MKFNHLRYKDKDLMGFVGRKGWLLWIVCFPMALYGQALRGTTGLLHAPTAEMQRDKTFMFGGNVLALTPLHYISSPEINRTYNYYVNVTFFPWLEVGYTCTLNYADHGSNYFPEQAWGKYTNQDRSFYARIRLWKEGWWKPWTPQVVLGLDDPASHTKHGSGGITLTDDTMADNHFTRYYLAMTKHVEFKGVGTLGAHVAWVMNYGYGSHSNAGDRAYNEERFNRPAVGVSFLMQTAGNSLGHHILNGLEPMIEYDARTVNVGAHYHLWKDRIHFVAEWNDGRYFSGGVYFKIHLK